MFPFWRRLCPQCRQKPDPGRSRGRWKGLIKGRCVIFSWCDDWGFWNCCCKNCSFTGYHSFEAGNLLTPTQNTYFKMYVRMILRRSFWLFSRPLYSILRILSSKYWACGISSIFPIARGFYLYQIPSFAIRFSLHSVINLSSTLDTPKLSPYFFKFSTLFIDFFRSFICMWTHYAEYIGQLKQILNFHFEELRQ